MQYETPEQLRDFLKLCLDPGPGREKRTPAKLIEVLPEPMHAALIQHAPHLRQLRHRVDALTAQRQAAQQTYADALAAWIRGDEQPAPARLPLPLLDAVTLTYDAAVPHIDDCAVCRPDMRLAEMCADGQAAAVAALDATPPPAGPRPHDGEHLPACAHVAWEVTREVPAGDFRYRKYRKCADCDEPLEPVVEHGPHWAGVQHDRAADAEQHARAQA
ncbi:hypothetical protein DIZ27_14585 [Streptomyces sp. NWU339]|uniref:hypothetical protein n=1 Tax=Streptomyces sp. NWU339 TaxID=2185284 RepID=UPI000D67719E|nr:hypothetical protein [Streptomyces sp. NWU339]PWI09760.1 hypothetical protein DIZ27_14585 [Streptomyces sp. NWU339]